MFSLPEAKFENCQPDPMGPREQKPNHSWNGSETSEDWTDATRALSDDSNNDLPIPRHVSPVALKAAASNSTEDPLSSSDGDEAPAESRELLENHRLIKIDESDRCAVADQLYFEFFKSAKARYKSKYHIFLCSTEELQKRMAAIEEEKGQIKPKQLSTMTTSSELHKLTTGDLINSITEICRIRSPFLRIIRMSNLGYYNWVLVDICRRMEIVQHRFTRDYEKHWEEEIRRQIINVIVDFGNVLYYTELRGAYKMIRGDGDFFDLFPTFVEAKRAQILKVASIVGDEICAFTEFIDIKEIGDMDPDEHSDFVNDLRLVKDKLKSAIEAVKESNAFHGDPTTSYNKVELLNEEVQSKHKKNLTVLQVPYEKQNPSEAHWLQTVVHDCKSHTEGQGEELSS